MPIRVVFIACVALAACTSSVEGAPGLADGDVDPDIEGDADTAVADQGEMPGDPGDGDAPPPSPPTSAGCSDGTGLSEGEHTFVLDGHSRRYVVRLPAGYTRERPWPLVLALPGNGGTTGYWDVTSGVRNIRGTLRDVAVLIIVEAIDQQWRDYAQDPSTWPARITQELAYFDEVLSQARDALCLREDAIFAMGFSGGGSFSGVLACNRTDIRAIAVAGSVIYFDPATCDPHGAAWIAISEGDTNAARTAYRDFFRAGAGCAPTSTATTPPGCVAYDDCDAATPVHDCGYPGGHEWPTFGSAATWAFFSSLITVQKE